MNKKNKKSKNSKLISDPTDKKLTNFFKAPKENKSPDKKDLSTTA